MDVVQDIMNGIGIRDYESASEFYDVLTKTTGIDGFVTKWGDESEMNDPNTPTIAVAFRSSQIKSADPVTYDNQGNVIPLNERFDSSKKDIRYSIGIADSQGRQLSPNQREFFKDSKAVDENGNLLTLYHGTKDAGFTVFNTSREVSNRNENGEWVKESGFQPIFLTTSKADADSYGGNDYERESGFEKGRTFEEGMPTEYRANITAKDILKKPSVYSSEEVFRMIQATNVANNASEDMSKRKLMSILKDIAANNDIRNVTIASDVRNDTHATYEMYADIKNPYVVDYKGARASNIYDIEKARKEGYDGVISRNTRVGRYGELGTVVVAFSPEQVKLVSNTDPTSSNDIRYSMGLTNQSEDFVSEGIKPEQTERLKSGKIPAKVGRIIQKAYNAFDGRYSSEYEQFGITYKDASDYLLEAAKEISKTGGMSQETLDTLRNVMYDSAVNVYEAGQRDSNAFDKVKSVLRKNPLSRSVIQEYKLSKANVKEMERNGIRFKTGGMDLGELEFVLKDNGLGDYFKDTRTFSDLEDFNSTLNDLRLSEGNTHTSSELNELGEEFDREFEEVFDDTMKTFVEDITGKQVMSDKTAEVIDSLDIPDEEFFRFVKRDPISPKSLERIEKYKSQLTETAKEWIPNYDIIQEKHPEFTERELNDALFEILSEGTISESTANRIKDNLLRNLSVGDNAEADLAIKELVDDSVNLFSADAAYKMDKKLNDAAARATNTFLRSFSGVADPDAFGEYGTYFNAMKDMKATEKDIKNRRKEAAKYRAEDILELVTNGKNYGNQWMSLEHNGDVIAKNDPVLRERFTNLFELPRDEAKRIKLEIKTKYGNKLQAIVNDGIRGGTKESAAVQYMLEGHTEHQTKQRVFENGNEVVRNVYDKYTLEDLKKDFPENWQKIDNAANTMREMYDDMYKLIKETRDRIYGQYSAKMELKIAKTREQLNTSKKAIEELKRQIKEKPTAELEAGLNQEQQRAETLDASLQTMLAEKANHNLTRRQEMPYRKDYAHHIYKQGGFFTQMAEVLKSENKIPTAISGMTENTQPYSRFSTAFLEQHQTDSYFPDAINGMNWYIEEASNIVGYDPYIEHLRSTINDIRSVAQDNEMNRMVTWLQRYADTLAGKTQMLDRAIREIGGEKAVGILRVFNNAMKKNAILGRPSSALVQIANLPNGLGILTQRGGTQTTVDIAKGIAQYVANIGRDGDVIQSPFMQDRYFDIDTKTGNLLSRSARAFSKTMLEVGDHEAAKMIWNIAYQQGLRKGEPDAVFYADDVTRRSIAGRGVGELPVALEAQTIKMAMPFQVETNNAYQTIKLYGKKKDREALAGFVVMAISSLLLNNLFEAVLHRRPGFDPIDAIADGIEESKDKDFTAQATTVGMRLMAEFLSTMPGTNMVMNFAGMTDDQKKKLFGDTDITRYNTGNIGLQPLVSSAVDIGTYLMDDENRDNAKLYNAISDLSSSFLAPGGGKQMQTTVEGLQSEGIIPQYVNGEWVKEPAYYTQSGKLGFVNDPTDVFDVITAGTLGRWHTKAAQEYLNNGNKYLSDTQYRTYDALSEALGNQEAYYVAKELNNISGIKDENGKTITNSASMAKRKYLEDKGVWDEYAKAMGEDYQSWGFGKKVATASDEEFSKMYSETFGESMKLDVANAIGAKPELGKEADLSRFAGTPLEKAAIQSLDMDEDVLQGVTDLGYDYKTIKQIDDYIDNTDSLRKEDGSAIRNTKALQMRQQYEELGVYDDIFEYISENGLDPQDYGLNKTVMGYSDSKFDSQYSKYFGGSSSSGSSGGKKSSSRKSSKSSKKSSKKTQAEKDQAFFDKLVAQIGTSGSTSSAIKSILKKNKSLRKSSKGNSYEGLQDLIKDYYKAHPGADKSMFS